MRRAKGVSPSNLSQQAIIKRLVYPIVNEAALCLEEGIAARPEDVDIAMVFGTGFAPFRGGPLRYADSVGVESIVSTMEGYSSQHPRLTPSDALRNIAANGSGFVPFAGKKPEEISHPEQAVA